MTPSVANKKTVWLLAGALALAMTANSLVFIVAALVGEMLAPDKALATLPVALQVTMATLTTIPASFLMRRAGRRTGFSLGALAGSLGGLVAAGAIVCGNFWWFLVGSVFFGIAQGCAMFYRFAAAEAASPEFRARAISLVLAGGVVAGVCAKPIADLTQGLWPQGDFAGCYLAIAVLQFGVFLINQWIHVPALGRAAVPAGAPRRPLVRIIEQPACLTALISGMIGYATMSLVMTATPIAMHHHDHPFTDSSFVIQWHVLAMYAPAFVTGRLIARLGVLNIIACGALLILGCVAVNLAGVTLGHFWLALVLLGIGWNFMFVGATTLLTETYAPAERAKIQAFNDFMVFGLVAIASFGSGALLDHFGWRAVNWGVVPFIALALLVNLWLRGTLDPAARRRWDSSPG